MNAAAARLGAPLAASLAFHAALLGALASGDSGWAVERLAAPLVVHLEVAAQPAARVESASAPARPIQPKRYWSSSEVDERAVPVELAALLYPESAYVNRLRGNVRLRIYISVDGQVEKADVVDASPKGHFEQAAIEAVQRTRFSPARKGGRPVPSEKLIEVEFDPYGPTPEERR